MKQLTKEILETIVEKTQQLKTFGFVEHVRDAGLGFHVHREEDNTWTIEFGQANNEKLHAFLFTFRLFIQHNEPISFHNLKKLLKDPKLELSSDWQAKVGKAVQTYFDYLDKYPVDIRDLFGKRPTNGEILDTVLYGELGHTGLNKRYQHKRQQFQQWARDEIRADVLMQVFTRIILNVFKIIMYVADLSERELKQGEVT